MSRQRLVTTLLIALGPCTGVASGQETAATSAARASRSPRRGPIEWREEWLLAQSRLTLPATSPDLLLPGETRLRLDLDWGNDFGLSQDVAGEDLEDRSFLIDGEHRTLGVSLRRGLTPRLEIGVRLPIKWRGGGVLDGVIEWFHGIGFPNNGRDRFLSDQLRVEGRREDSLPVEWTGSGGIGFGKLELDLRGGVAGSLSTAGWRVSVIGRVALPTGTGTFSGGGLELGGQLLAAHPLGRTLDLFLGAGATHAGATEYQGLVYEPNRAHSFLAVEWRPWRAWSFLAQLDAASRDVVEIVDYPGIHSYLRIGTKLQLGERWQLDAGFGESIKHLQATTDFSIGIGLTRTF